MNSTDRSKLQIFNVVEVTTSLNWFTESFFHISLPFLSTKCGLKVIAMYVSVEFAVKRACLKFLKVVIIIVFPVTELVKKWGNLRDCYVHLKKKEKLQMALVLIQA